MTLAQVIVSVCMISGAALTLVAAIGIARFPDLLARMHAATKPQVLGLMLMMAGLAVGLGSSQITWKVTLVVIFQLITAPVAAHMVGRAGYRTGKIRSDLLVADELTEDLEAARLRDEH
ncbi:monovalent cation/H(+) antiporter subunit G [Ruania halotolerans]|uniref:monovalent cation/H(+) antiporter subunit G n=1 Tax=Ruania halotolerans TaxID=2897773 RepID=UPI001E558DB4|nr:monovalent cation/H(+) antiporter subunit G [Ruania halotolerans]UFU06176.1 monovalent cation/H(+) antiporter subunit G [Ruania halotolerans]